MNPVVYPISIIIFVIIGTYLSVKAMRRLKEKEDNEK